MHSVGHVSSVVLATLQSQMKFTTLRFSIQPKKCVAWSPLIHLSISLPLDFLTFNTCLCILGAIVGYIPFVESFVAKVFQKYFNTIISPLILADP